MDIERNYPISDSRYIRNNIIHNKIKEQLSHIRDKYKFKFYYDFLSFIVNPIYINQVVAFIPATKEHYCGDIVLLLTIVGETTIDDILNSLSSYTGPELQVEEINSSFPFYFNSPKTTETHLYPGRYGTTGEFFQFLKENTFIELDGGRIYFEYNSTIDKLDLNKIHLVFKDSENKKIIDCTFQDPITGLMISREEMNNKDDNKGLLLMLFDREPHKDYGKIKND